MSVILKALRVQSEEGRDTKDSFQVDQTGGTLQEGGPGSGKRQIFLLVLLLLSVLAFVVIQYRDRWTVKPPPVPASVPNPVAVTPIQVAPPQQERAVSAPETQGFDVPAPLQPDVNNDLQVARSQYKSGEYEESLKSFQKAINQDPNNAGIHNDLGLVLLKKELYVSAEGHFAKALELDDTCAECYNNLGYLKTALDQPVEAEKYLQKAVALKPDYADPYFNLAVMYEKNGDVGKAVNYYREYMKRIPKSDTELLVKIKSRVHDLSGE